MAKLTFAGLITIMIASGLTMFMFSLILAAHIWTLYDWFQNQSPETGLLVAAALMLFIPVFIMCWIAILVGNILCVVDSKRMDNRPFAIASLALWAGLPLVAGVSITMGVVVTEYIGYMRVFVPLSAYAIMIAAAVSLYLCSAKYVPKWAGGVVAALFFLGLAGGVFLMFPSYSGKTMSALIPMEAALEASLGFIIVMHILALRKVNLVRQTMFAPGMPMPPGGGYDMPMMLPPQGPPR